MGLVHAGVGGGGLRGVALRVDDVFQIGLLLSAGSWLAGGDPWMLHAWVVPRWTDMWGPFATLNPKLCPPVVSTPGIARCENTGG